MAWIRMDATGMGEIPGVVTGRAQPAEETRRPGGASAHTQLSTRLPPGCPLAAPGCLFVLALPPTAQYPRPLGLPPVPQAAPGLFLPALLWYVHTVARASLRLTYGCRLFVLFLLALLWKNQYMKASQ